MNADYENKNLILMKKLLQETFVWKNTKQGHQYWSKVQDDLQDLLDNGY